MKLSRQPWGLVVGAALGLCLENASQASDHLDTPTTIANPQADIGDIYAWMSPEARQLNLVMTIVGRSFSDRLEYTFHVDSGRQFGKTTKTVSISCRFHSANDVECRAADADVARGDASDVQGLQGQKHHFRVFAGLRDDPFFNNVRGTRAAYNVAAAALKEGARVDAAGCPNFDSSTSQAIFEQWRHTDGGPAKNFLVGWTSSAIVLSIDVGVVNRGGQLLAVWGTTSSAQRQIDRAARPLTGNALLGTLASDEVSDRLKEKYNSSTPARSAEFVDEIEKGLALYDGFDGQCGNQLLVDRAIISAQRYRALAALLADDRLWVNSQSSLCTQLFAVELAQLAGHKALLGDCGGRTPLYDAANVWRSLLVDGTSSSVSDGVEHDDQQHSATVFPFLAAPDATAAANSSQPH
jgi:hypothetical protein